MKIASLCVLAYKRPEVLERCLISLHETVDYPCEIIVNVDASFDLRALHLAFKKFGENTFSKLIISNGENRGVGRSFANCVGISEGDIIVKIDTDLIFKPHWLSTTVRILENDQHLAALSLFNYNHYDPKDKRFEIIENKGEYSYVSDFVSSIYAFRKYDMTRVGIPIEDDGYHQKLCMGWKPLAITNEDFVENVGFGLGKSTYVVPDKEGNPIKAITHDEPLIFSKE